MPVGHVQADVRFLPAAAVLWGLREDATRSAVPHPHSAQKPPTLRRRKSGKIFKS